MAVDAAAERFEAIRAELRTELEAALAERPALAATADAAKRAYEDANNEFQRFQIRVARASRHGADEVTPVVANLIAEERRRRDAAGAAMSRARLTLENIDWEISRRRAELSQLELLENPPDPDRGPRLEVIKRPAPPGSDGSFDPIEFPNAPAP